MFVSLWTVLLIFSLPLWGQNRSGCKGPEELERAASSKPSATAYNALGAYFAGRKQFACAIAAFEKALQIDSSSWETRYNLGLALIEKAEWERATPELRRVVAQKPGLLDARNALGTALQELGDAEAVQCGHLLSQAGCRERAGRPRLSGFAGGGLFPEREFSAGDCAP